MKKYDLLVIGVGPAGMAVAAMGTAMGLKVLAIESHKVGGECLNYGCIPSKALLKAGEACKNACTLQDFGLNLTEKPSINDPLQIVRDKINDISGPKTMKMFDKVDFVLQKGNAKFVNKKIIEVDGKTYTAKHIFIGTGTEPFIPPIPGIKDIDELTNLNMFEQKSIPKSLLIIGGGAIGSEMAQAFTRLGSQVTIVQIDKHLMPQGDEDAGLELQKAFEKEGIKVLNNTKIEKAEKTESGVKLYTSAGILEADKLLVAAGRKPAIASLELDNAKIKYNKKGIIVNDNMQTNIKNVYAIGDCNGLSLFSHAAMHQGMIALMNAINPLPFKMKNSKFVVPWSVFTKPEVAQVGLTEKEAIQKGLKFQIIKEYYENYGRTIADGKPEGFVKVITDSRGKIYGATIVGEAASEMIHEWALAIQKNIKLFDIMMLQHSFPTISLMNKRIAESWMMNKMKNKFIQKLIKFFI
ncbi:MAG: FAD-dependent oxidoreductase [Candidatus Cloacimonetes bacterium]|nr:FAD-dependent oxidoreductase [Candidatus Cloacimonadota bacterium]MDD4156069.1 FAD-dependent oxidoreductase [Candidatus Cloacimonadota bacterium]